MFQTLQRQGPRSVTSVCVIMLTAARKPAGIRVTCPPKSSPAEMDKVYSEEDFRGITGLKDAALKEVINNLKKEGWITPSQKCRICYLFVNKNVVGVNEDVAPE